MFFAVCRLIGRSRVTPATAVRYIASFEQRMIRLGSCAKIDARPNYRRERRYAHLHDNTRAC